METPTASFGYDPTLFNIEIFTPVQSGTANELVGHIRTHFASLYSNANFVPSAALMLCWIHGPFPHYKGIAFWVLTHRMNPNHTETNLDTLIHAVKVRFDGFLNGMLYARLLQRRLQQPRNLLLALMLAHAN